MCLLDSVKRHSPSSALRLRMWWAQWDGEPGAVHCPLSLNPSVDSDKQLKASVVSVMLGQSELGCGGRAAAEPIP